MQSEEVRFNHGANLDEIHESDFNLNIPRYVDTFELELEVDLEAVTARIRNGHHARTQIAVHTTV